MSSTNYARVSTIRFAPNPVPDDWELRRTNLLFHAEYLDSDGIKHTQVHFDRQSHEIHQGTVSDNIPVYITHNAFVYITPNVSLGAEFPSMVFVPSNASYHFGLDDQKLVANVILRESIDESRPEATITVLDLKKFDPSLKAEAIGNLMFNMAQIEGYLNSYEAASLEDDSEYSNIDAKFSVITLPTIYHCPIHDLLSSNSRLKVYTICKEWET